MTDLTLKHCYHTLGLEDGAGIEQVRSAYRRLARAFHPDLNPELGGAVFSKIQAAYDSLLLALGEVVEVEVTYSKPAELPQANRRTRRRGTPGNRRFETIMEDQYKGVNIRIDA